MTTTRIARCMIIGSLAFTLVAQGAGPCATFDAMTTYVAGDGAQSVAMGDLDGDLDLDLAVANANSDNVSVLLNNGDGTFADDVTYVVGGEPRSVAMGDLDGDLALDLAVANQVSDDVSVLMNNCNVCPCDLSRTLGRVRVVVG